MIWGITGTGFMLQESIDLMKEIQEDHGVKLTVILSKEGAAVVKWYKKWLALTEVVEKVKEILNEAADKVDVGPMAAVAGAIAEHVGKELLPFSREVIVENGGDIFLRIIKARSIGVYAGETSPFSGKIGLEISPEQTPLGICASSGTVGHSLSFGGSDACIVLSHSTALADAAATAIANLIGYADDIPRGG